MIRSTRSRRAVAAIAGASIFALGITACGDDSSEADATKTTTDGGDAAKDITLTVATFNNFGYTDALLQEYMDSHPGVKVVHNKVAKSDDARLNLTTRLAAGGDGLADVEAIELDWMPELDAISSKFEDLSTDASTEGRWLDWKVAQGTASDGRMIGAGTDIGPEAICYRKDLFEAAGLPSDREAVAELLGGANATWDKYFEVGEQFVAKSDSAWFDSAGATWQGMVGQISEPYENKADGTPKDLASNTAIEEAYNKVLKASETLSGNFDQWSGDWDSAFQNNGFATMLCPGWMTASIEERSGGVTGWDVADVFPGGSGNWGGSFLTVPSTGKNVEAARELALWLTDPAQQTKAFQEAGNVPSQIEALKSDAVQSATNDFFNNAPVGQIFANRANALTADALPFKGQNYFKINQVITDALKRVDVEKTDDAASSWKKAVSAYKDLGL